METVVIIAFSFIMTFSALATFKVMQASIDEEIAREQESADNCLSCGHRIHNIVPKS